MDRNETNRTNDPAANPDPITKAPGAHPIGTGVDFHADNTTHRHVSPPTPIANHALCRCASQPLLARSAASVAACA